MTSYPRGSEWRRWDPHIHAPGTLLNDQFGGDWSGYFQKLDTANPAIAAIGITDYFCIRTYSEVKKYKESGSLPNIHLLFPNVELRLDLRTSKRKGLNLHLLFSPDDPNHQAEIERLLASLTFEFRDRTYRCSIQDLTYLGHQFSPKKVTDEQALSIGANQFKVKFEELRDLFRTEKWLQRNCLVAVAGGSTDGTSGLQDDDAFTALRSEVEAFAHIIFSATPSQREFWLGKHPNVPPNYIEKTYRALKPCLHGSDAHSIPDVAATQNDRHCWLKGDPTFETLRQAVIEPEERVWIGESAPATGIVSMTVTEVRTSKTPWLATRPIPLNCGLVAIIGARGSGKTALADLIAAGASAFGPLAGSSSFLIRASSPTNYLTGAEVSLDWGDGSVQTVDLSNLRSLDEAVPEVAYLSQHFVEKLCSSEGLARELRDEMERVIFEATEPTERMQAASFAELSGLLLEPVRHRKADLQQSISSFSEQVIHEEMLKEKLPRLKKQRQEQVRLIASNKTRLAGLVPKGQEDRARELSRVDELRTNAQATLERLARTKKLVEDLKREVGFHATKDASRVSDLRQRFGQIPLSPDEWAAFRTRFQGDPEAILDRHGEKLSSEISRCSVGDPTMHIDRSHPPDSSWPLNLLVTAREELAKQVGADVQKQRQYRDLHQVIAKQETALRKLSEEISAAEGADARRKELIEQRRAVYADTFRLMTEEEEVLNKLYAPLSPAFVTGGGTLSKLEFVVQRHVNLQSWVASGETLIDLRKATKLRGHGTLREHAEKHLLGAWQSGTAEEVAAAMDVFRTEFQDDLRKARPGSVPAEQHRAWVQNVAAWLYSTAHVGVDYSIRYDGIAIEQLSPGTRGIVLLLLYLVVDRHDQRPLVIDQPEENLDPNSVFAELVPHFREARKRRQIIVVTHNANLVVNTDADQVIVADARRNAPAGLPSISYDSGSLENANIRRRVCEILEGGDRAFLERERRYRLPWN